MIWIARFVFLVLYMILCDLIHGLLGLVFSRFDYAAHPRLHKFGLRRLAMCEIFGRKFLVSRCQLDCENAKCGNWTCPRYHKK